MSFKDKMYFIVVLGTNLSNYRLCDGRFYPTSSVMTRRFCQVNQKVLGEMHIAYSSY